MKLPNKVGAVIVAAGQSKRMGTDKIFMPLGHKPLIAWSIDTCQNNKSIEQINVVLNENNLEKGHKLAAERNWSKINNICLGGKLRQESVTNGLKGLDDCEWIIIHDGARPFITDNLINNGLKAAQKTGAAIAAVPVKDTIKLSNTDYTVKKTLPRENL